MDESVEVGDDVVMKVVDDFNGEYAASLFKWVHVGTAILIF